MIHTEASITINKPIEETFAVATDFARVGEWRLGLIDHGYDTEPPTRVGTRYRYRVRFGGQTMDLDGVVTEFEPPVNLAWKPHSPPFPITGGLRLAQTNHGTVVNTYSDSEPTGFMKAASWLMKRVGERQYRKELEALKDLLESPVPTQPSSE